MSHNHGTGYKGFRSMAVQACTGLKPGESIDGRDSKFKNVGWGLVYEKPITAQGNAYETLSTQQQSLVKSTHYKLPDRRGVAAKEDQRAQRKPKKFIATTTASTSFVNNVQELLKLKNTSEENFRRAFDLIDSDGSGFIEGAEVKAFLRAATGKEPLPNHVAKFVAYFDSNQDGKISWEEFSSEFANVINLLEAETQTGSGRMSKPGWMKDAAIQRRVLQPPTFQSSYQADVGKYGEDPMNRQFTKKTGMLGTTKDLNMGTSKDTYHIPGYGGYIPFSKTNPAAVNQGDGEITKRPNCDLRLTHNHNLPGYTGHRPVDSKNDYGPRETGKDCRTSSGDMCSA